MSDVAAENVASSEAKVGDAKKRKTTSSAPSKKRKNARSDDVPSTSIYLDIPNPAGPVIMYAQPTHSAPQVKIASDGLTVTNEKGYRLAKSSHGTCSGTFYYEVTISFPSQQANARIGYALISADLQTPVGTDSFGYGVRVRGERKKFHCALGTPYGPNDENNPIQEPSEKITVGVMIHLPYSTVDAGAQVLTTELMDAEGHVCEPLPEPWRMGINYVPVKYYGPRPICKESWIRYWINGVDMGVAFSDIYAGKYHAAIALYMGATARVNYGERDFTFPPPKDLNAMPMSRLKDMVPPSEASPAKSVVEVDVNNE